MMNGVTMEKPDAAVSHSASQVNEPATEFNHQINLPALQSAWKEYSSTIENENPRLFSILNNQIPTLENGVTVKLELRSQMQESELLKEKNALFTFLKNKLKNNHLELQTTILKEETEAQMDVFTASDKLRVMMEKNPALAKLKQHFNLDLD